MFLHSVEPLALQGTLPNGSFMLYNSVGMQRLRQLTSCPASWRPEVNATLPQLSFESLVDGQRSPEFCILGALGVIQLPPTPIPSVSHGYTDTVT